MILWEKQKFCHKKKIQWKWNKLQGKWQYFKCGGNQVGKRRQNAKFTTFYCKSRGETNSTWPNKSVISNRTFFGDNFFEMLCKETNLYYFQNQGKYTSSSKDLNGWMSVGHNWKEKIIIILQYCHSTNRNVSRDITDSSITRSLGKCFLKILVHKSN
jgi:hypothetical protein